MSAVKLIRKSERQFVPYAGDPAKPEDGIAHICRMVGPELSRTMGVGVASFEGISVPWTVLYDEAIVVLEGDFRLRAGDDVFDCKPGDVLWIPENTPIVYEVDEGKKATVFYSLYPVDWRARHGM